MLADRVDQQAALLEADVAGRRADQPRHRVLLHVLAHVEADELVAEVQRELLGELGLADAGRTGEQEAAGRPIGLTEAGARALDRVRDRCTASSWPNTTRPSDSSSAASRSRSDEDACLAGMRAMRATTSSMSCGDSTAADPQRRLQTSPPASSARRDAAAARPRPGSARQPRLAPASSSSRWRCRAACSRAGAARPAWPPPRARRRCSSR